MGDSHLEEVSDLLESRNMHEEELTEEQVVERDEEVSESKAALRALIADTVAGHAHDMQAMHEVEVDFERQEVAYAVFYDN